MTALASLQVLVVCTANRCRSPIGEVVLSQALERAQVPAEVTSAGFLKSGVPAEPEAATAVAQIGLDLSKHRSRQLTQAIVDHADLILTMERRHAREIAVQFGAMNKTFTFKDFAERASSQPMAAEESEQAWLHRLAQGREKAALLGSSSQDELTDPIGNPLPHFVATRKELEVLSDRVAQAFKVS